MGSATRNRDRSFDLLSIHGHRFEKIFSKLAGSQGYADVWWLDKFAGEYKNQHATLDRAVWAAYGWPEAPEATDDETILARLLALNLERAVVSHIRD